VFPGRTLSNQKGILSTVVSPMTSGAVAYRECSRSPYCTYFWHSV